jgi:hypothetical protein
MCIGFSQKIVADDALKPGAKELLGDLGIYQWSSIGYVKSGVSFRYTS